MTGERDGHIAVVGIGCRFAGGVDSAETLWRLLLDGAVTAGEVPPQRWRAYAEHSREHAAALGRVVARGSFLADVAGFDAAFFGISAAEAGQLDPQQRTALEVAWEALEDAGIPPDSLAGSDAAVYLGVGTDDYGRRLLEDLPRVRAWTGIGASLCGVPNRISHALDLRGPSVAVDTACSSSLVAVHSACTALRAGETRLALAGGVMLMTGPGLTAVLGEAGAISADGRSKPFDANADGYGRGEGCGVVVLKRLADARADGDEVLAVIRGGAVRQDGRTDGIMAPNGDAQRDLMRAAYRAAGVDPASVGYVEAHGTGTPAGDPMEAGALCTVLARPADRPVCRVGSVKANLGHTEAAAGVAGLIKTVLVLRHGWIPATPTPCGPREDVPFAGSGLACVPRGVAWPEPEAGQPRRAGVASYGYGGTIAHLVLEAADPHRPVRTPDEDAAGPDVARRAAGVPHQFALSAASPAALAEQAGRLAAVVAGSGSPGLGDIAVTLARGRTHLRHRAVLRAEDRPGLLTGLRALAAGTGASDVVTGTARDDGAVWVFSGHGAQWAGMGRGLLDTDPAFTATLQRLAPVYAAELGATPRELIEADDLGGVARVQAALCAVQLGLAASWRARGLRPAAVLGHSVGEIAAAVAAGSLAENDAALLVCRRSVLLTRAAGRGAMVLVDASFADCTAALADLPGAEAAIMAAPESTVIAGDPSTVDVAAERFTDAGRTVRRIDSDVAFHTAQLAPLAAELAAAVAGLRPRAPHTPLYLTALPDPRAAHWQDADYWAANLRNPVRFADAVAAALDDGHRTFLEISAHPVVAHSVTETLAAREVTDGLVLPSLRRDRPEHEALAASAAALHCRGIPVQLSVPAGRRVRLPGVAWQHTRYWVEHRPTTPPGPAHTLLGPATDLAGDGARLWPTTLHADTRPYPGRHPVLGTEIVPAAVTLLTYLAAGECTALSDVELRRPVVVPSDDEPPREVQVIRDGDSLRIASRVAGAEFTVHSAAVLRPDVRIAGTLDAAAADEPLDAGTVVDRLAALDVAAMGFPWRVDKLTHGDGLLVAEVAGDPDGVLHGDGWAALLDAALSTASVLFDGEPALRMPAALAGLTVPEHAAPERAVIVACLDREQPYTVDVDVCADDGTPLARLRGLRYAEPEGRGRPELGETVFDVRFCELPPSTAEESGTSTAVLVGDQRFADTAALPADPAAPAHLLVSVPAEPVAAALAVRDAIRTALHRSATRVWVLTTGLADGDPVASAMAGLGRVLATEHPEHFGGVLDLPAKPADPVVARLRTVLGSPGTEPVRVLDASGVRVPRAVGLGRAAGAAPVCRPDGTYLITGGLGAVGLAVATHLAGRGARRLVLLGRTPLPPRGTAEDDPRVRAVRVIEAVGAAVFPVAADLADEDAVRAALAGLDLPPVRGVLHAAGEVRSGPATELSTPELDVVLRAKVDGARTLDALYPPGSLDFLVLFSSVGPLLGLPGQAAYAVANGCLDGLATARRAAGDTGCVSVAWTSWRGLGMATAAAATDVELDARGSADLTPERSLAALDRVLAARHDLGAGPVAVLPVRTDHPGARPALLAGLHIERAADDDADARPWAGLAGAELTAALTDAVTGCVAAVLGSDVVEPAVPLGDQGVDSLLGATLRVRLERATGVALAPTLLWNHPTVGALATHLADRLAPAGSPGTTGTADEQPEGTD